MGKHERNIYLTNIEVEKALGMFFEAIDKSGQRAGLENVSVIESRGRITSEPVFARLSSPNFNASAMDGIALEASVTFDAEDTNPKRLKLGSDFIYVDTGDFIDHPHDAVIMIEDVNEIDDNTVEIIKPASPWQHIRPIGEDIVAGEMIIPSNHEIRPVDIGALLSGGITEVIVYRKPSVGIIPTGTEIVEPGSPMKNGYVIESNSRVFEGLVHEYGGHPRRYAPVIDDYGLLRDAILKAADENDLVIINAGSSAGSEDFTSKLIEELGDLLVHGIATKPGKPSMLGIINGKPVVGVPGYPVSAFFAFEMFAVPVIRKLIQQPMPVRKTVDAILSRRMMSSLKHREYSWIKLGKVGDNIIATPLNRGAGVTMSLVRADGIMVIPQTVEGIEAGDTVRVELLKELSDISNTIVSIGSHDLIMDLIGNLIHRRDCHFHLSSSHSGSLAGIMSVRKGEAHMAPIHLLDETTGEYNIPFIRKYIPGRKMALIKGVKRVQGLMVRKGNPDNITGFEDLSREGIHFVNRQRGAGTRVLLDFHLKRLGICPESISGYDREMTTHMSLAAAISSGSATTGLGVYSAAEAMGLDFIPLADEEYDFAVPADFIGERMMESFIETLVSDELRASLEKMGGYKFDDCGKVILI